MVKVALLSVVSMWNMSTNAYANASLWDVKQGNILVEMMGSGAITVGALQENGAEYGGAYAQTYNGTARGTFGLADGFAISVSLPYESWKRTYADVVMMQVDPALDRGTITSGRLLGEDVERRGAGVADPTLALSLWPSSWGKEGAVSTRIIAGFALGNQENSRWLYGQESLGSSAGANTWLLGGALWRKQGKLRPWVDVNARIVGTYPLTEDAESDVISPPSDVAVRIGVRRKKARNSRFSSDLFTGFSSRGGSSIPSGILLPSVLSLTEGMVVNSSPAHSWSMGVGQEIDIWKKATICWDTELTYHAKRRLESTYEVYTSSRELSVSSRLSLLWRAR